MRGAAPQALRGHRAIREPRELTEMQAEVYDPVTSAWAALGDPRYLFSYHMMFNGPDGKLYVPGPIFSNQFSTLRLDPATGQWSSYGSGTQSFDSGTGVLIRPDVVMKAGQHFGTGPARGASLTLQLGLAASPAWLAVVDTLALGRRNHTITLLPTGEAIVTGGDNLPHDDDNDPDDSEPRRRPELFDLTYESGDKRGRWYGARAGEGELLAEEPVARSHHSSALLLPDGRILSGGGHDTHDAIKRTVDLYSPPYLFDSGAPAFRPRLVGAQDHITWGQDFKVSCLDPIVSACLVRPGAATHTFNQDQRYVPLEIVSQVGSKVTLRFPAGSTNNHAPPGNYLLFVLSQGAETKVPSVARWVNVGAAATSFATWDTLAPGQVIDLGVTAVTPTGSTVTYTLQWSAPGDFGEGSAGKAARYELRYRTGTPIGTLDEFFDHGTRVLSLPTPGTPGTVQSVQVTGLSASVPSYFRLISRDDAGSDRNWSVMSNEATPQSGGCPFAYTLTATGWQVENSILSRSATGGLSLDDYRLRHAPLIESGLLRLSIREDEQEHTTLDRVRLIAVDHAPELEAHSVGERVRLGTRAPVHGVRSSLAGDLTWRFAPGGGGHTTVAGETLWVDLTPPPGSARAGELGSSATQPGGGGFIDGDGGKGGGPGPQAKAALSRGPAERLSADAWVLAHSGLRVEAPDGAGDWRHVTTRYPREHDDERLLDSLHTGTLRLVAQGAHRIGTLARFLYESDAVTGRKLVLASAMHSALGDVSSAVDSLGNLTTLLSPGERLELAFEHPTPEAGLVRDYFLLSHGVYSADLPASRLPTAQAEAGPGFALHGASPSPVTDATTLSFELARAGRVALTLHDVQGRRVAKVTEGERSAGVHRIAWSPAGERGRRLAPGVYLLRLASAEGVRITRVVLAP